MYYITIVIMNLSIEMVEHDMGRLLQQSRVRLVTHVPVQHHLKMVHDDADGDDDAC